MLRKVFILAAAMVCFALFGIVSYANPDGPHISSSSQYKEYKIGYPVTISWGKPLEKYGTVDHYEIAIRGFKSEEDVTKSDSGTLVLKYTMPDNTPTYVIKDYKMKSFYEDKGCVKFRVSICAVMTDGKKRWSDHLYFYLSLHNTSDKTTSFRIYNGFSQETKDQIYYACQNWNKELDIGREIVNTYPYSMGTDKAFEAYDGENIVSKRYMDDSKDKNTLMVTVRYFSPSTYELLETDIIVNSRHSWSNAPQSNKHYVYNALMHEMGHAVGLCDKYDVWATEWTMYGDAVEGESKKTTLEEQDIINGRLLYK